MDFEGIRSAEERYLMRTYGRQPVAFVRGEGARLWDTEGREYLDFVGGIAVCSVGHAHPRVAAAVADQAARLVHVSNLYYTEPQVRLAERLNGLLGWGRSFFCNSGAEANEAAIKLARRATPGRAGVVSAAGSFHGRTIATLAATGQPHKHEPFVPLPPEFRHVPYGDAAALDAAVDETTSAVLLEPVQGEGGVVLPPEGYLAAARAICDERGAVLILDEVQTGIGRTGRWFGFEHAGVRPDVITLAKALGGGLPIGACVAREEIAAAFGPGDHATTFGGGPVPCAAALAVLDIVEEGGLVARAAEAGTLLRERLAASLGAAARDVRGAGLLVAVEVAAGTSSAVVAAARERGLLVNNVTPDAVRLAPPLVITDDDIEEAAVVLSEAVAAVEAAA